MSMVYDSRPCQLGEGPLWHPERQQLFWFDIIGRKLMTRDGGTPREWTFPDQVSAAGWIDRDTLLIASERALIQFDLSTGTSQDIVALEADTPRTRSNDGRADPMGGFWIGTMAKTGDEAVGSLYRYYRGELRVLMTGICIPNATCFSPDGRQLYFADTATRKVTRTRLDKDGWPDGDAAVFLDLGPETLNPDGAVTDVDGNLWLAEWGSARVSCYSSDGTRQRSVAFPARHTSCPAFGGADLTTLYCTSALQGINKKDRAAHPLSGQTFAVEGVAKGRPEPRVIL